ncbi:MAG TPA: sigma 54-interacting transcriptional regulator [Gammaproteobacteria bacterium]|nr:sigma 54-interacting transcriptional regulator [Gammaproteobacteria bacterium]
MNARILIADDDPSIRRLLTLRLRDAGYEVQAAVDGEDAFGLVGSFRPDLLLTDMRMPGMDGMALFAAVRQRHPSLPVIILTAHGNIPDAVEATRSGVFGYVTKPFDSQALLESVANALRLGGGPDSTPESTLGRHWRASIITRNPDMESLLRQALMAAIGDGTILIQGERGTGKTLIARALHGASSRAQRPFVDANAAVIPESLLEAEFFGHDPGAFPGNFGVAGHARDGLLRAANGGTLYIAEIDALPPAFEAALMHAVQNGRVRPLGSDRPVPIDVRLIVATRRDLTEGAAQQRDLLEATPLAVPPLGARREDIPLLATHFLVGAGNRAGKEMKGFSPQAMDRLLGAPWPGNVRELREVVDRAVALASTPLIPEDTVVRALGGASGDEIASLSAARDQFERNYLAQLLHITEGNVSHAARIAQRNRTEFYKLLHRHSLDPKQFRRGAAEG